MTATAAATAATGASATAMSTTMAVTAAVMSAMTIIAATTIAWTKINTTDTQLLSSGRSSLGHRNVYRLPVQSPSIFVQSLSCFVFVDVANKTKTSVSTIMSISRNIDISYLSIFFEKVIQILLPMDLEN